ncbi:hypothetical protein [Clostridium hydrogenum]|uniref:hypothetical protein n=1 Tax=Clostridium hydrogenum TaxID=2855764 RepID=UPI001F2D36D1|nr:hypothetical protein [Clostridium hydrogenum]
MLSSNLLGVIAMLGTTVGVLGAVIGILPYAKKKGINVDGAIKELNTKGALVQAAVDEVKALLPIQAQGVINLIEKWAPIAVGNAEQLYHAGDIGKDDRAGAAESVVLNVLKELNIEVDDNKKALIDATIKNAVNDLGHVPVSEAEKNKQLQDTLNKVNTLESQNQQLQQKLNTIKSTAAVQ